jgi:hypothetical protein
MSPGYPGLLLFIDCKPLSLSNQLVLNTLRYTSPKSNDFKGFGKPRAFEVRA